MKTLTGTVAVGGRTFMIEAIPNPVRGTWIAAAGEGSDPTRWSRLGDGFDTAGEALAAAAGGVLRLLSAEARSERRAGCVAA